MARGRRPGPAIDGSADDLGTPHDVADVIVFLASEQARWVTGQLVYVGGGHQMGL
jgi:NAD(P)-dependent dehydrogenase (short-subunit alcohol dehydrogenase family)